MRTRASTSSSSGCVACSTTRAKRRGSAPAPGAPRGAASTCSASYAIGMPRSATPLQASGRASRIAKTRQGGCPPMLKIAMISDHASPLAALGSADAGGQNVYVAHLTRCLADRGIQVDVFTRRVAPDQPEVVAWYPGSRVIHVPAGPAEPIPKEELLPHMDSFTRFVRRACRRRGYDLLHANFWMSGLAAAEVKLSLDIPYVITFHALGRIRRVHQGSADRFPDSRFQHEERIARSADRIIAECPQDRADLMTHYAADAERISIVPCGFDPSELAPMPKDAARAKLGL